MKKDKIYPWYFCISALSLYIVLFLFPSIIGLLYSFTDWNSYTNEVNFVGIQNFVNIFLGSNKVYLSFLGNTVQFAVISIIIKTTFGLILALLLTHNLKFTNFHRVVAFSPQVLSYLIIGLAFKGILHPSTGFLNIALNRIGLGAVTTDWLGSVDTAFASIIGVDAWKGIGFGMVIFIAGIQSIPKEYFEAAEIDGANYIAKTLKISIPFLMPSIVINIVLNLTYGLRVFDIIYVLTNGGPGYTTDVINTVVFREFSIGNYAMGTALSTLLSFVTILISYFIIKGLNRKVEY